MNKVIELFIPMDDVTNSNQISLKLTKTGENQNQSSSNGGDVFRDDLVVIIKGPPAASVVLGPTRPKIGGSGFNYFKALNKHLVNGMTFKDTPYTDEKGEKKIRTASKCRADEFKKYWGKLTPTEREGYNHAARDERARSTEIIDRWDVEYPEEADYYEKHKKTFGSKKKTETVVDGAVVPTTAPVNGAPPATFVDNEDDEDDEEDEEESSSDDDEDDGVIVPKTVVAKKRATPAVATSSAPKKRARVVARKA